MHYLQEAIYQIQRHKSVENKRIEQRNTIKQCHTCQNGHHQKVYKQQILEKMWRNGNPRALWKIVWSFFIKLKIELPYDSAIPFLSINPEKNAGIQIRCHHREKAVEVPNISIPNNIVLINSRVKETITRGLETSFEWSKTPTIYDSSQHAGTEVCKRECLSLKRE